jgi:hypothetical protein
MVTLLIINAKTEEVTVKYAMIALYVHSVLLVTSLRMEVVPLVAVLTTFFLLQIVTCAQLAEQLVIQ